MSRVRSNSKSIGGSVGGGGGDSDKRMYEDMFLKPLVTAAVGTAATKMTIFAGHEYVTIRGMRIPLWVATGISLYGAGVIGELLSQKVLPHIARDEKFKNNFMTGLVQPAAVGGAYTALFTVGTPNGANEIGIPTLFFAATAAEMAGDYLYNHFVLPLL